MKTSLLFTFFATATMAMAAPTPFAEPPKYAPPAVIPPPTELAVANSQPKPVQQFDYTPRINRAAPPPQVVPDKQKVVDQFRDLYAKQNKPRVLLYINREFFRPEPKEKDAAVEEKDGTVRQQIMSREIEEAFAFPLQDGGAVFVDRHLASLNADKETLRKNADIAIEVLMEERGFTVDNREVKLPVMTVTATQLSDAKILSRVTSMGLFGLDSRDPNANLTGVMVQMTPSEIAQEVSFALMRDLNHAWEK